MDRDRNHATGIVGKVKFRRENGLESELRGQHAPKIPKTEDLTSSLKTNLKFGNGKEIFNWELSKLKNCDSSTKYH